MRVAPTTLSPGFEVSGMHTCNPNDLCLWANGVAALKHTCLPAESAADSEMIVNSDPTGISSAPERRSAWSWGTQIGWCMHHTQPCFACIRSLQPKPQSSSPASSNPGWYAGSTPIGNTAASAERQEVCSLHQQWTSFKRGAHSWLPNPVDFDSHITPAGQATSGSSTGQPPKGLLGVQHMTSSFIHRGPNTPHPSSHQILIHHS
jgi:hypothetical protein